MTDKQIVIADRFAVATDGIQWVLQRRKGRQWQAISFVRSTKAILARCLREAGASPVEADTLLSDLPPCFPGWDGYDRRLNRQIAPCHDCGLDTCPPSGTSEWYMVNDDVWASAGIREGYLCIGCIETRLGRQLVRGDFKFPDAHDGEDGGDDTPRLRSRLVDS